MLWIIKMELSHLLSTQTNIKTDGQETFSLLRWNCLLIWTYDSISREDSNQAPHLQHYYGLTGNHV